MRIRDVAARCQEMLKGPAEYQASFWQNPEERRDFYQTIIKLCQKKEDLFTSPPHDAAKVLGDGGLGFVNVAGFGNFSNLPPSTEQKTAIDEAKEIIYGDREQTYGMPDRNFHVISHMWNAYLKARGVVNQCEEIKPSDIGIMMVLLKVARHANVYKRDNIVDGIGYFACVDRIKEELNGE